MGCAEPQHRSFFKTGTAKGKRDKRPCSLHARSAHSSNGTNSRPRAIGGGVTPQGPAGTSTLFTTHSLGTAHHSPRERPRGARVNQAHPQVKREVTPRISTPSYVQDVWGANAAATQLKPREPFSLNTKAKLRYQTCPSKYNAVYVKQWGESLAKTKKRANVESFRYMV